MSKKLLYIITVIFTICLVFLSWNLFKYYNKTNNFLFQSEKNFEAYYDNSIKNLNKIDINSLQNYSNENIDFLIHANDNLALSSEYVFILNTNGRPGINEYDILR